ncbi:TPM domain-containing protein [Tsuneonella mangrovi]|uniref:TPM domain-containing protein n=1 Tax=Tsuneonella mangrovi TaxID=1982042 RepID=UPI001F0A163E|nr:TPM domain-containing protein [Tsuneonella mangrovi]
MLDQANVFPVRDEAALSKRLTQYWAKSGNALVVATISSLEGKSIDDYALGLFNDWGIGDAKTNRGILVLLAPNERKVRIEIGCGLEGVISDSIAKQVIENQMTPLYRQGQFERGTIAGVDSLIAHLQSPAAANDNGPQTQRCRVAAKAKAA